MAHSYDEEEPSMERHIHYNKRGELQMVGQKSLFDLDEPVWHADEKVRGVRGYMPFARGEEKTVHLSGLLSRLPVKQ